MTLLAHPPVARLGPVRVSSTRASWSVWLYAVVVFSVVCGVAVIATSPNAQADENHLAMLLRFMAVTKLAVVIGATALAHWRLRAPLPATTALGYIGAVAPMAVAPGLIWSLNHLVLGAACFHAGLLAYLVIALRDDAVGRVLTSHRR